ncbi:HAMP domain-containing protein, partial [Citrobacter sp. AAK_AS5]
MSASAAWRDFRLYSVGGGLLLLAIAAFGFAVSRSLADPMRRAARVIDTINAGDISVEAPPPLAPRSEIGRVSNALRTFLDTLADQRRL